MPTPSLRPADGSLGGSIASDGSAAGGAPGAPGGVKSTTTALACAVILVMVAVVESSATIRADDIGYLVWGLLERSNPWAWVTGPDWVTYHRPLAALAWWAAAHLGIDGGAVRWGQVGLWLAFCAAMLAAARSTRRDAPALVLLLVGNQVFVDLLQWRSWITTTGSLAALAGGAVAMQREARPALVAAFGVAALGFKEVAPLALAVMALADSRYRRVGVLLLAAVLCSGWSSRSKLGLDFLPANAAYHASTVALCAPMV